MNLELPSLPAIVPGTAGFTFANAYGISVRPTLNRLALIPGPNPIYPKKCPVRAENIIIRNTIVTQLREKNENYVLVENNGSMAFHFILNPNWEDYWTGMGGAFLPEDLVVLGLVLGSPAPEFGVFEPDLDWYTSLIPSGVLNETLFVEKGHPLIGYNRDGSPSEGIQGIQIWCEEGVIMEGNHVSEIYNLSPEILNVTDLSGGGNATLSIYSIDEQRRAAGFLIVNISKAEINCNTIEGIFSENVFVPPNQETVASIRFIYQEQGEITIVDNSLGV